MTTYTCPVCGYDELPDPPEDWTICPCCLTEFGFSYEDLGSDLVRQEWIRSGAKWGAPDWPRPENWSAREQLRNIGYEATHDDLLAMAPDDEVITAKMELAGLYSGVAEVGMVFDEDITIKSIDILPGRLLGIPLPVTVDSRQVAWQPAT